MCYCLVSAEQSFTIILLLSRAYSKQLCEYRDQCGCMLEEVGNALEHLQEMKERHQQVSHKTNALHQSCEQLVDEQVTGV